MNINSIFSKWLKEYSSFSFPNYEDFPDIDLYMEQLITYMEKQLEVFKTSSLDKQITSSMINNYVKSLVLIPPVNKKYSKEHFSLIQEICTLKEVLSISQISQILNTTYKDFNYKDFNNYKKNYEKSKTNIIEEVESRIKSIKTNDIEEFTKLSVDLAVQACCYAVISKRILFLTKLLQDSIENEKIKEEKMKNIYSDLEEILDDRE